MFEEHPTCLILDEFQTWYTGLPEKDPKTEFLLRAWASNFIQNLSEIAKDRPEILIFAISVLNNQNDAFQQVHRQGPVLIDFGGPAAKQDRRRLLLHRLFKNRDNIPESEIINISNIYAGERFRLLHQDKSEAEKDRIRKEVFDCWPFSPELLVLLEDHFLLSQAAQETRDLIRILAHVFRSRGDSVPVITPSDFFVDSDTDEVQSLIDSIAVQAGQEKLREIAQRNLESVRDAGVDVPNARELISSIWMRSMSPAKNSGGTPVELHLDITRQQTFDDNTFQAEITMLIENSVNIHGDEVSGGPLWFGLNENPRSKVRACARNNKLWQSGTVSATGQIVYPEKDIEHIRNTLRHILVPEINQPPSKVIILGPNWKNDPWSEVDETDQPEKWDRPVLLVIPDQIKGGQAAINACLGEWLAKHVQTRRSTVRFLLLAINSNGLFNDKELTYSTRCSFLCSKKGWGADPIYRSLHQDFVLKRAKDADFVGSLMNDLAEPPPPNTGNVIPFLCETKAYEFVLEIAAKGDIILNVNGTWIGRRAEDISDENALRYIRSKAFRTGQEMRKIQLAMPGAIGGGTITAGEEQKGKTTSGQTLSDKQINRASSLYPDGIKYNKLFINDGIGNSEEAAKPPHLSNILETNRTSEPTTGINLSGSFEKWGISSTQIIKSAKIEFNDLTAQQIKQILQRIPSTFKAMLKISYKKGGEE
ncbi:MAG: hypothetical protein JJV89_06080 [Desulfosarcina sp.]|nr:hypothetical protein [Desulfobacterales bacterium]